MARQDDPSTNQVINLELYMGTWYEIARYPNKFQAKCGATSAQYSLTSSGRVNVLNICELKDRPGEFKTAKGIARVVNKVTNAVLSVSFVPLLNQWGLFGGDYRIIAIDDHYEMVLVGDKKREFLWVLSRTPHLSSSDLNELIKIAEQKGFDPKKIITTPTWE
jgi:apolipoprotein D and lipocalin family protein